MLPNKPPLRIIWITPKYPLGAPDGARHATCILIRNLSRLGAHIDLICLLPQGEQADPAIVREELGVSSCTSIVRSGSLLRPFPSFQIPLTFRTFADRSVTRLLQKELVRLLKTQQFHSNTVMLFDGLHTFAPLSSPYLKNLSTETPLIYRAHNVESVLWEQCVEQARKKPWIRWLYRRQAALVRHFEQSVARTVSWVASVSQEDASRFQRISSDVNASSIPIGVDFPSEGTVLPVALGSQDLEILFIGRLDWIPNKNGLRWFLDTVWPAVHKKRPALTLNIAGVGDGRWLTKYSGLPGVRFLGKVAKVEPWYETCALTIAPIFQGSGTRVKILESARFARPVVSTALGAEGSGLLPGLSYYQAENQQDWVKILGTLTREDCRSTGWRAFQEARQRFDGKTVALRFMKTLEGILPQHEVAYACHL